MFTPCDILEFEAATHEAEGLRLRNVIADAEKAIADHAAKSQSLRYAIEVLRRDAPSKGPSQSITSTQARSDTIDRKARGLPARVLAACQEGESLTNSSLKARIGADGGGEVNAANLNATLHRLAKAGQLENLRTGVYRRATKGEALIAADGSPQLEGFNVQPVPQEGAPTTKGNSNGTSNPSGAASH